MVRDEQGQAVVEYLLLLAVVVGFFMVMSAGLKKTMIGKKLMTPITVDFARAYKYGHPKAEGTDEGGSPKRHPRYDGEESFRIFMNPGFR